MADRPIIMSGPMVRAIMAGRKTQTRRVLKPQPEQNVAGLWVWPPSGMKVTRRTMRGFCQTNEDGIKTWFSGGHKATEVLPARPGDRLWVREAFVTGWPLTDDVPDQYDEDGNENPPTVWYRATSDINVWMDEDGNHRSSIPWRSPIHMPRWASRITLHVTDVRVQRVQEISEADAEAEGVFRHVAEHSLDKVFRSERGETAIHYFRDLWDGLNAKRGFGWEQNPWIVALTFKPEFRNIDQCEAP